MKQQFKELHVMLRTTVFSGTVELELDSYGILGLCTLAMGLIVLAVS